MYPGFSGQRWSGGKAPGSEALPPSQHRTVEWQQWKPGAVEIPNLLVQTLTTSKLFVQGIAQGNDALLIDYSVLYDQTVRATLWVEVHLSVFSLCPSSCWSLSVHLSILLSVCLYICPFVCPSIHPSIHLPLSVCLSPWLCLSVCLPVSVHLSVSLPITMYLTPAFLPRTSHAPTGPPAPPMAS